MVYEAASKACQTPGMSPSGECVSYLVRALGATNVHLSESRENGLACILSFKQPADQHCLNSRNNAQRRNGMETSEEKLDRLSNRTVCGHYFRPTII